MKVLFLNEPLIFSVIPREYPSENDNISLTLRNEMTDNLLTPSITFEVGQKLQITIVDESITFVENQKFEVTIKKDDKIIYLGKLIILKSGTDIQNYEYKQQTNARYI
jgi:hypothetical protein